FDLRHLPIGNLDTEGEGQIRRPFRYHRVGGHAALLSVERALEVLGLASVHPNGGSPDLDLLRVLGELHAGREGKARRITRAEGREVVAQESFELLSRALAPSGAAPRARRVGRAGLIGSTAGRRA